VDVKFRFSVLGAGRLGEAIASTWIARTGDVPLIWSRAGARLSLDGKPRVVKANWAADWSSTLAAESIAIAIPGRALLELAEGSEEAARFSGNVFSAASSLSRGSLQRVFPRATIVCISPFLIDGVNSIPMLVLRPHDLPLAQWLKAKAELENLGDFDVVEDEETFAHVALLGASWPVVISAAVHAAARAGVQRLHDETAMRIGRRIFFRAIQSLLTTACNDVATPDGITERGLKSLGDVNNLFEAVFRQMQARAEELRA
jgi:pyrroline-5-carboxylate reductase